MIWKFFGVSCCFLSLNALFGELWTSNIRPSTFSWHAFLAILYIYLVWPVIWLGSAIIDISGRGTLRYGPVRDPVKSLVDVGVGDDVDTVIVDGITRVEGGRVDGVDMAAVHRFGQEDADRLWGGWRNWDVAERTAEEVSPWSFPLSVWFFSQKS